MPIQIRHLRLHNQSLLRSTLKDPAAAVKALVAVQAQDYHGAKWGLGQRCVNVNDSVVEQAFADGRILRLHVMRPTWHFVTPDDIRWLVTLTAPRVKLATSYYFRQADLDDAVFKRTNRILTKALRDGREMTRAELRSEIKRGGIDPGDTVRLGHIMHRAELDLIVCSGARKGNQFTYALVDERVPRSRHLDHDEALGELATRYFVSRGPATLQDFVWWSGLTMTAAKRGLEIAGTTLRTEVINGKSFVLSSEGNPRQRGVPRTAHLLPPYDEYLIAYKDRSAAMRAQFDQKSTAQKLVFYAPLVIDGVVVGGWKRVVEGNKLTISIKTLIQLSKSERRAVDLAGADYARFIGKELSVEWL